MLRKDHCAGCANTYMQDFPGQFTCLRCDPRGIIKNLERRKEVMIDYMRVKIQEEDWHGVSDAAMDIREMETEMRIREEFCE